MQQQPKQATAEQRRQAVREECKRRGIRIEPMGKAYRLTGLGVEISVADLVWVTLENLLPYQPRKRLDEWC